MCVNVENVDRLKSDGKTSNGESVKNQLSELHDSQGKRYGPPKSWISPSTVPGVPIHGFVTRHVGGAVFIAALKNAIDSNCCCYAVPRLARLACAFQA